MKTKIFAAAILSMLVFLTAYAANPTDIRDADTDNVENHYFELPECEADSINLVKEKRVNSDISITLNNENSGNDAELMAESLISEGLTRSKVKTDIKMITYIPEISEDGAELCSSSLKETLLEGFRNLDEFIDISDEYLYVDDEYDMDLLKSVYSQVFYENYDLFYLDSFDYWYDYYGKITVIEPYYALTDEYEIQEVVDEMDYFIDCIIAKTDSKMSQLEKLLTVYDTLILECEYETDEYVDNSCYNATGPLIYGKSVCQGYSMALYELAKRLGIKGGFVTSDEMGHMWNVFYIDGKWFNADITWEEFIPDRYGLTRHFFFLKSDAWMLEYDHEGFTSTGANSTYYDNAFWNEITSAIVTVDGYMYYIDGELDTFSLMRRSSVNSTPVSIFDFSTIWYYDYEMTTYYKGPYSGLSYKDGLFYTNGANKICTITPDGKTTNVIFDINDYEYGESIYGCYIPSYDKENIIHIGHAPYDVFGVYGDGIVTDSWFEIPIPVTGISLDKSSLTLEVGDYAQLIAEITPDNATNQYIKWYSENDEIAEVDSYGAVYANSPGTTTICATTEDGSFTAKATVTVTEIKVQSIELDIDMAQLYVGESIQIYEYIYPKDAYNQEVIWESSNTGVATVTTEGLVTAVSVGKCTITATTVDGGFTAKATITVLPTKVEGIEFDVDEVTLTIGETFKTSYTIYPEDAGIKDVIWLSDDASVATVNSGTVTAKSAGECIITATTVDGSFNAQLYVSVKAIEVTGISISHTKVVLNPSDTFKLECTVKPDNATDKTISWHSSNSTVAGVDMNGLVTAKSAGTAIISATSKDGKFSESCEVQVVPSTIFTISDVTARAGDRIEVDVALKTDKSFNTIGLILEYDSSVLEYNSYYISKSIEENAFMSECDIPSSDILTFVCAAEDTDGFDDDVLTLIFDIKDDAELGTYKIVGEAAYLKSGHTSYETEIENGNISVVDMIIGDINCDNCVDMNDAILLLQYSMFPELYPLGYKGNVDFTKDGNIDMNDAILLLQHSMFPGLYPIN